MAEKIAVGHENEEEKDLDTQLRPRYLREYIGQDKVKENLSILISAAKARGEPVDHVLFCGPPGLGKTTLAVIIANELGVRIKITSGPAIEHQGALGSILMNQEHGDVLFIDEIHRLGKVVEEALYPAMEDFKFDFVAGKGTGAQIHHIDIPRFTLAGATTRQGLLSAPLRERFGVVLRLDYYSKDEIEKILKRSAKILNIDIDDEAAQIVAARCRGTPRVANRLLKRIRDFAQVRADGRITANVANDALDLMGIDQLGLDEVDHIILDAIVNKFQGGPVGVETLATVVGEDSQTIEDVYEPYLMKIGFIKRTPRGRIATEKAFAHLGVVKIPNKAQLAMFTGDEDYE
jgi:Holliday junction DNA helicase RuvB